MDVIKFWSFSCFWGGAALFNIFIVLILINGHDNINNLEILKEIRVLATAIAAMVFGIGIKFIGGW